MQLEAYLGRWRAFLQPKHALLFSQLNGAPLTVQGVYKVFQTSAFRISGKKTNPHLVRDMVVTHLRCPWLAPPQQAALVVFCTAATVLCSLQSGCIMWQLPERSIDSPQAELGKAADTFGKAWGCSMTFT